MINEQLINLQRSQQERQEVVLSIRTTHSVREFMTKHKIQPALVFRESIRKIIEKTKEKKQ